MVLASAAFKTTRSNGLVSTAGDRSSLLIVRGMAVSVVLWSYRTILRRAADMLRRWNVCGSLETASHGRSERRSHSSILLVLQAPRRTNARPRRDGGSSHELDARTAPTHEDDAGLSIHGIHRALKDVSQVSDHKPRDLMSKLTSNCTMANGRPNRRRTSLRRADGETPYGRLQTR